MESLFKTDYNSSTIGVIFPSKGRPEILDRTLRSLSECILADRMEVVIVADQDPETFNVARKFPLRNKFAVLKTHLSTERLYSVKGFVKALELCESYLFCWMNDENLYRKEWLINAVNAFNSCFPDDIGVLSLYKMKKAGLGMSSRKFIYYNNKEWFYPGYTLYYPDDELTCRAILLGRYAFLPESGVTHDIEVTKKIPIIPWEERIDMKKKDRGIFYRRNDVSFNLDLNILYEWPGFVPVNRPLRKSLG